MNEADFSYPSVDSVLLVDATNIATEGHRYLGGVIARF